MSRSYKGTSARPQSAGVAAAQQIAAQQLALTQGFGVGGTSLSHTALRNPLSGTNTSLNRTAVQSRPLSRTAPRRPAPRSGSAASPVDDHLSSFGQQGGSGAQSHFGHTSPVVPDESASSSASAAPAALENEYIVNLQQQVYFLELELNLLKKAGGGGGSTNPTGLRGSGGDASSSSGGGGGGLNDANVPDAPLDDVMLSLREKYVRMESEFKKEQAELKAANADLRSRARMRELELSNLKHLHGTLATEAAQWRSTAAEHQSTLLDHQLANEQIILKLSNRLNKREAKLEKVLEELVHLRAEHKVTLESYASERANYTTKWNEREAQMDSLNQLYLREKETNLEWGERFRQSQEAALQAQIEEMQTQQLALETRVRQSDLAREQAEKNKAAAQESLARIMDENEGLRRAVQGMEGETKALQEKEARDRASKAFWSTEVAQMTSTIASLTDKLARAQNKYAESKGIKKQLKDELIKSRTYLDEMQNRLADEQAAHAATRSEEQALADTSRELKRDLTLKTEELQTLMTRFKEVRAEGEEARKERDALHVQLTELQTKLEISDALSQVKLHEFVSMAHSNLKVAGAIENLMGKLKKGESDGKAHRRDARRAAAARPDDLYSDATDLTPRTDRDDSRPSTQQSSSTQDTDSRPVTASSTMESSFDGV